MAGALSSEAEQSLQAPSGRPPRHWDRGVWIRFALAITPTIVFAILGYLQTH
jgi:hypothetical protein